MGAANVEQGRNTGTCTVTSCQARCGAEKTIERQARTLGRSTRVLQRFQPFL